MSNYKYCPYEGDWLPVTGIAKPISAHGGGDCSRMSAPENLKWAVFPCGWKWEIGTMTRENELPVAIFEHKHHAEAFCKMMWPQLGEVRVCWPSKKGAQWK